MVLVISNPAERLTTAANSSYLKPFPLKVHGLGEAKGIIIFHK